MATILPFNGRTPTIHPSVFLAPTAVIIGDVTIGAESSIWFGAVLRGDDPENGIVIAGREYGTGSSRDWAAKGTFLLGVKAVIAESYERIHRSNLVGMGVLPLLFKEGENADTLGLTGRETYDILGIENMEPGGELTVRARDENGETDFRANVRLDSIVELEYYRNGGILHKFLRDPMIGK